MTDESDKRHEEAYGLMPANWDKRPMAFISELREMLSAIKDEGTCIDSGGGDGNADLWVKVGGVEYYINVQVSNAQPPSDTP